MGSRESINPIMITLKLVSNCHDVFISGRKSSHPQNSGSKHGITFADIEANCGRPPQSLQQHHPNERFACPVIFHNFRLFCAKRSFHQLLIHLACYFTVTFLPLNYHHTTCCFLSAFIWSKNISNFNSNYESWEIITARALIMAFVWSIDKIFKLLGQQKAVIVLITLACTRRPQLFICAVIE